MVPWQCGSRRAPRAPGAACTPLPSVRLATGDTRARSQRGTQGVQEVLRPPWPHSWREAARGPRGIARLARGRVARLVTAVVPAATTTSGPAARTAGSSDASPIASTHRRLGRTSGNYVQTRLDGAQRAPGMARSAACVSSKLPNASGGMAVDEKLRRSPARHAILAPAPMERARRCRRCPQPASAVARA